MSSSVECHLFFNPQKTHRAQNEPSALVFTPLRSRHLRRRFCRLRGWRIGRLFRSEI